ncbi:NAD-binding protein [Vibrio cholerae]|nr:NAD-binding protein [Vibrio cholerae]
MSKNKHDDVNFAATAIAALFALSTLVLGLYGFSSIYALKENSSFNELTKWSDVIYSTLRLFTMESAPEDDGNSAYWAVSLARAFAAITVFYSITLATLLMFKGWFDKNIYIKFYKNHYIVIGVNDNSEALIADLIARGERVVVLDKNPESEKRNLGAICINVTNTTTKHLLSVGLLKAKAVLCMDERDIDNLNILADLINSPHKPAIQFLLKINSPINLRLFEPQALYSIDNIRLKSPGLLLTVFDPNEFVALDLFKQLTIGFNADTCNTNQIPVTILIMGLGAIGRSVLRETLLMAHFGNNIKSKIYVYTENQNEIEQLLCENAEVFKNCNGNGLDLWDIIFIENKADIESLTYLHHVISCYENEQQAMQSIFHAYDTFELSERNSSTITSFHYYSASDFDMNHEKINSFGSRKQTLAFKTILDGYDEVLARKSHEEYARQKISVDDSLPYTELEHLLEEHDLKEKNSSLWLRWINQPLFKRRANFAEKRHQKIKLLNLGGVIEPVFYDSKNIEKSFPEEKYAYLSELKSNNKKQTSLWLNAVCEKLDISHDTLAKRIDALAECEHARWNAFYIVNNWRYGPIKNERTKTHDCLLTWEDLKELRPDTIIYDYQNIYHIPESLKHNDRNI